MHHLLQNEQVFEVMGDFLGDKLYKIRHQLVQTGVILQASDRSVPIVEVVFIEKSTANLLEVQLEFFGQDVFHLRLDGYILASTHSRKVGIRAGALGHEFLIPRVCRCWILRDRWLDAFNS